MSPAISGAHGFTVSGNLPAPGRTPAIGADLSQLLEPGPDEFIAEAALDSSGWNLLYNRHSKAPQFGGDNVFVHACSVVFDTEGLLMLIYRNFVTKYKFTFPTLRNPSRSLGEQYGTVKIPESYIISRDGHLLQKVIGGANWTDPKMISYFDGLTAGS